MTEQKYFKIRDYNAAIQNSNDIEDIKQALSLLIPICKQFDYYSVDADGNPEIIGTLKTRLDALEIKINEMYDKINMIPPSNADTQ